MMNFRLELPIKPFSKQIHLKESVMLIGSCFTDHISKNLAAHKFRILENPHGILFNPKSIEIAFNSYINKKIYNKENIFLFNDLWSSWEHHGQFSHPEASMVLQMMNEAINKAHVFLKNTQWIIITLGSSWIYELKDEYFGGNKDQPVANCHKVPQQYFCHRLLSAEEVNTSVQNTVAMIKQFNPLVNIIFTISPVRHHREGLIENNRSKALLISAVHKLVESQKNVFYFPSYELIIDDLRDYRFYAEDLVHPNHQATQYVWGKFIISCIDETTIKDMEEINKIVHAANHRPLHPTSQQHQQFLATMLEKAIQLQKRLFYLNFDKEIQYFRNNNL